MKFFTHLVLLGAALFGAAARADYPERSVTLVVPYAAGGPTDRMARELAAHLQTATGKPFLVENKPGAGGVIGMNHVMRAPPDGYTLLLGTTSEQIMIPEAMKKRPYVTSADFTPVGLVLQYPFLLVGNPAGPSTVQELLAKGQKSALNWGILGPGGGAHLVGSYFLQSKGIAGVPVLYKGSADSTLALMRGEIDFVFDSYLSVGGQVSSGKIKALAVSTHARMAALPQVPTLEESGFQSFDESIWQSVLGPKGLPPSVVELLNKEINRFLASPQLRERLAKDGATPLGGSADDYRKILENAYTRWHKFIVNHNIKIQE